MYKASGKTKNKIRGRRPEGNITDPKNRSRTEDTKWRRLLMEYRAQKWLYGHRRIDMNI
jgi:hypothetical protein